jgi:DNA modification methylase
MPPFDILPVNQILEGDSIDLLDQLPANSVDLIFADPPYNLQLRQDLWRPNLTKVNAVKDAWDQFDNFASYDDFSRSWLTACRRVLKDTGSIWVIGSYHNIFRLGTALQDMGFWILNDIIWIKTNPMPNFRGVRFANAHETLIWAAKSKDHRYQFNHHAMKMLNGEKQMRSDWVLPICSGPERLKIDGKKAHSTQKPLALLYRVILASTLPGDIILDPFFGTGTTGVAAKILHRHFIGFEKDADYVQLARERIIQTVAEPYDPVVFEVRTPRQLAGRIPFGRLLEAGLLRPGQVVYFRGDRSRPARIKPDGLLRMDGLEGSIHQLARQLTGGLPCNGWDTWYFETIDGGLSAIDHLRQALS